MLYINPIQDSGGGRNIGNKWVKRCIGNKWVKEDY